MRCWFFVERVVGLGERCWILNIYKAVSNCYPAVIEGYIVTQQFSECVFVAFKNNCYQRCLSTGLVIIPV